MVSGLFRRRGGRCGQRGQSGWTGGEERGKALGPIAPDAGSALRPGRRRPAPIPTNVILTVTPTAPSFADPLPLSGLDLPGPWGQAEHGRAPKAGGGEKDENPPPKGPLGGVSGLSGGPMSLPAPAYSPFLGRCARALRYRAPANVTAFGVVA